MCVPYLHGLEQLSIVSPIFVCLLLLFFTGIPQLERQWELKYGDDPKFQKYRKRTPLLVPCIGIYKK